MNVDTAKTVREVVLEYPQATRVFENLGIDYCCGGQKSLQEACAARNLAVDEVLASLAAQAEQPAPSADRKTGSLAALISHIVGTHHAYVKAEVPRLEQLLAKVCSVHGQNHPELHQIRETFAGLGQELSMHLMKEENILFPYIVEMENAVTSHQAPRRPMFGTVKNPVQMMIMEHDSAGDALRSIRAASSEFTAPEDACISYRTLYSAFQDFEADLHQHIHLENNILFPRAVAMESGAN
ncbi:MAG: iron-sulfur cluster repair di-iron protein [Acidobacteriia bacterium]|nr:iron-sulfur cluster repair di-iron protein [Terriglobia bacterium]MBZ5567939.1 iron-sulfur cluster repair di-iron protein [Terriglobia bacterium]